MGDGWRQQQHNSNGNNTHARHDEIRTCSICPGNLIATWAGPNETRVLSLAIKLDVRCEG
jgi:hypothetical protein